MKKLLSVVLGVILATYASAALADDDVTIWVSKAGDNAANIYTGAAPGYPGAKCIGTARVMFTPDASWDNVKDSYSVAPDITAAIAAGKESIAISSDGTAIFHKKK